MNQPDLNLLKEQLKDVPGAVSLLGLTDVTVVDGKITLTVKITKKHLNNHATLFGGALYAICDQAAAAFDLSMGRKGAALDGHIHYYRPAKEGDILTATVTNRKFGKRAGINFVEVHNQDGKLIGDCLITSMYCD